MRAEQKTDNQTDECKDARDAIVEDGDPDTHAGGEEQSEVPHLVGQLVAEDGNAGGEPGGETHREGGAHR